MTTTAIPPTPLSWGVTLRRGVYLALALGVATMAALLAFGGGVSLVVRAALSLSWVFVGLAFVGVALEWMVDAARFVVAGRAIGVRLPARVWLEVALVNLFAAYVANIGPPVAAYVMVRRGVSAGDALAVTVGKHLLFFPSALGPAWLLLYLARNRVGGAALFGTMTGLLILSMAMFAAMVAVAFWPVPAERLLRRLTFARHGQAVSDFVSAIARFFRGRADLLLASLLTALANQACILATVAVLLVGFGGPALTPSVLSRCYLFSTLAQIAPTPGGVGISEGAGVLLFRALLPNARLVAYLALCRFFCAGLPIMGGGFLLARLLKSGRTRSTT